MEALDWNEPGIDCTNGTCEWFVGHPVVVVEPGQELYEEARSLEPGTHVLRFAVDVVSGDSSLWEGELTVEVEAGEPEEVLPAVSTPELDLAVRRSLGLRGWDGGPTGTLFVRPALEDAALFEGLALHLRVHVLCRGEWMTTEDLVHPRIAVGSTLDEEVAFRAWTSAADAPASSAADWSLLVRGLPLSETSLLASDVDRRWGGEIALPCLEAVMQHEARPR